MVTALALFTLLAAVCSIIFNKLKLPPLIGYIIAGIVLVNVMFIYQDEETILAEEEIISLLKDFGCDISCIHSIVYLIDGVTDSTARAELFP